MERGRIPNDGQPDDAAGTGAVAVPLRRPPGGGGPRAAADRDQSAVNAAGGSPPRSWEDRDDSDGKGLQPLILAHRGASAVEPENSLLAFRRARADGADGVELDVLACATGEVVVFHDDDLQRLGNRPETIAGLSLGEIRGVRLLSGATIPTLDEALDACGDEMLVNVELKASAVTIAGLHQLVDAVAALIERRDAATADRVLISSFHPRAIALWQRRAPAIRAGLLFERDARLPLRRAWALRWLRPFSAHPEAILCAPQTVRRWRRRGYRVIVWTVDDVRTLRALHEMGVDGIITNDPARARRALAVTFPEAGPADV